MENIPDFLKSALEKATELRVAFNQAIAYDSDINAGVVANADSILQKAIGLGKRGRFKIAPENIAVPATQNCNLQCIMCNNKHTGMSGPKISVEEAKLLFGSLADKDVNFGRPKLLDMTSGEPTLNQNLGPIYRLFKDIFPDAKISLISNATLPIRGRVREAFDLADRIGLSIDGATKETYERIRKGSVYENVVRNIKDVVELKKQNSHYETFQLLFVAMDQNIHELPAMVRLTHSLGVPGLFVQAVEVRGQPSFNDEGQNITLSMSEIAPYLIEAKAEASRLGVMLVLTSVLEDASRPPASNESVPVTDKDTQVEADFEKKIKTCSYPWFFGPGILQNNEKGIYPKYVCCHMPRRGQMADFTKHPELDNKSIIEIFNSAFYWNIRSALLDGSLARDACEGCQYHRVYQWTASRLKELEAAVNAAEQPAKDPLETA